MLPPLCGIVKVFTASQLKKPAIAGFPKMKLYYLQHLPHFLTAFLAAGFLTAFFFAAIVE
jgi:hypothetical protein